MNTSIKICGITNQSDAEASLAAGAHALGFNFYRPSPRYIEPENAREIISSLPPFVTTVAVLVDPSIEEVRELTEYLTIHFIQLHGDESPEQCSAFQFPYIKAIRVNSVFDAGTLGTRYTDASALLLDTLVKDQYGGTGEAMQWQRVPETLKLPVILAGGLRPDNVEHAIRTVKPYAVDVSSGVEIEKGQKDPDKLQKFIASVRAADEESIN